MTSLPSLPTDNLYKFMALAGLTVLVISVALSVFKISEIQRLDVEIDGDIALLTKEAQWMHEDGEENRKRLSEKRDDLQRMISSAENMRIISQAEIEKLRDTHKKLTQEIDDGWDSLNSRYRDGDRKSMAVRTKINLKDQQLKEIKNYAAILWVGIITGGMLALSGFTLWYLRSQRFIDAELKQKIYGSGSSVRRLRKNAIRIR